MSDPAPGVPCPACGGLAEPEQDGELTYHACGCGHEFGYAYRVTAANCDTSCPAGIPEDVRRRGRPAGSSAVQPPVLLQIGRRP